MKQTETRIEHMCFFYRSYSGSGGAAKLYWKQIKHYSIIVSATSFVTAV